MVKKLNQILEKQVLPEKSKNGQRERITRHSDQGPRCVPEPMRGMFRKVAASEQGAFQ